MLLQNLGGQTKSIVVFYEVAYWGGGGGGERYSLIWAI